VYLLCMKVIREDVIYLLKIIVLHLWSAFFRFFLSENLDLWQSNVVLLVALITVVILVL